MALSERRVDMGFLPAIDQILPRRRPRETAVHVGEFDSRKAALDLATRVREKAGAHVDSSGNPIEAYKHKLRVDGVGVVYLMPGKEDWVGFSWPDSVKEGFHTSSGRATLNINVTTGEHNATLEVEKWLDANGNDVSPRDLTSKPRRLKVGLGQKDWEDLGGMLMQGNSFIEPSPFVPNLASAQQTTPATEASQAKAA